MMNSDQQDWVLALAYVYLQVQHYDKAIQLLETISLLNKSSTQTLKILSYAYFKNERLEDAFVASRKWLQAVQKTEAPHGLAPMYLLQGRILLKLNRKDLAKKCMQKYKQSLGGEHV